MFSIFFVFLLVLGMIGVVGVGALVVWAVHTSNRTPHPVGVLPMRAGAPETPQEILARRFASGEITAEEYERARDLLGGRG